MPTSSPTAAPATSDLARASSGRPPSQGWIVVQFVLTGSHLGVELPVHEGRARRSLARSGRLVAPDPGRAHPRALRRAPPRHAAAQPQAVGAHDRAGHLVLRCAVPALLLGAAARDLGTRQHLQRDHADHDRRDGGAAVPGRAAEARADRRHPRRDPGGHGHHRAVAGPGSGPEPDRAVRDPRRDRVLRVQPRLHAQVRLELRHERAGVLVPEHRDRRGDHGSC